MPKPDQQAVPAAEAWLALVDAGNYAESWKTAAGLAALEAIEVISVVGDGANVVVTCVDELGNLQLLVGDGAATP